LAGELTGEFTIGFTTEFAFDGECDGTEGKRAGGFSGMECKTGSCGEIAADSIEVESGAEETSEEAEANGISARKTHTETAAKSKTFIVTTQTQLILQLAF